MNNIIKIKFNKQIKIIIILSIFLLVGFLIYQSPDEGWGEPNIKDAINMGRIFSYYLLDNNSYHDRVPNVLSKLLYPAKEKNKYTKKGIFVPISALNQLKDKKINHDLLFPLLPRLEDLGLISFDNVENFVVSTFVYKDVNAIKIPDKGYILFSVALRYEYDFPEENNNQKLLPKLIRKIKNLPIINLFTTGTTGQWFVFDFSYTYNLEDYFQWLKEDGENYSQLILRKSEDFIEKINNFPENQELSEKDKEKIQEIDKYLDSENSFYQQWTNTTMNVHIENFQKFYETKRDFLNNELGF